MKFQKLLFLILFVFAYSSSLDAVNGGILPYAYKNGKAYFLFGLENRTWDAGKWWTWVVGGSWVWTDFGGKCDDSDAENAKKHKTDDATYCASRECAEETRYVFGNRLPLRSGLNNTSAEFKNSVSYWIRHITKMFNIADKSGSVFYYQFFAQVDYIDPDNLVKAPKVPSYEKDDYQWILVEDVIKTLESKGADGLYRFSFMRGKPSNKMLPWVANNLLRGDVQKFIKTEILNKSKETSMLIEAPRPGVNIESLHADLKKLQKQLENLKRQLMLFS
jgi:hypothetical protein